MKFNLFSLFIIAVGLGTDAFSVALGVGMGERFHRQTFRLSFHFGLFQTLMPLIGWGVGRTVVDWVRLWDHWIAFGILTIIAIHMLIEAVKADQPEKINKDLSRGWYLVSLSLATSIDALAVGLVFGVVNLSPWWPSLLIGVVAAGMTLTGLRLGRRLKSSFGRWIEIAGGVLLLLVAIKMLDM